MDADIAMTLVPPFQALICELRRTRTNLQGLESEFALHRAHNQTSFLLRYELIHVVCPSRAILLQVVHAVSDNV